MFETLARARSTTKKIETADDLEDFAKLNDPEKEEVRQLLKGSNQVPCVMRSTNTLRV